jgi:outer membrane immunogenic protein
MRKFLMAAAMMLGVAHGAQAADMPDLPVLRGSFPEGLSSSQRNWQGYYIGGQANYGSVVSNIPSTINANLQPVYRAAPGRYNWPGLASPHANNTGFGGYAGYNSQWDDVVIGLEANYIHGQYSTVSSSTGYSTDVNGTLLTTNSRAAVKIDDFGSLRVRAGYVAGSFLPYLFLGGGVGNMVVERSTSVTPGPILPPTLTTTATKSNLVYGYSAGAGVDIMLIAGLFLRAEYEYQRVTSKDVDSNINSARVGVGYKF